MRLRYIVVMHNKRICTDVCKFLNCTVFLQDQVPRCNSGKLNNIDGFSNFYSVYHVHVLEL